jgi:hypothetical protein
VLKSAPLQVGNRGKVLAHLAVQPNRVSSVVEQVHASIRQISVDYSFVDWVLGETDLLLRLSLRDFRQIRKLQSSLSHLGLSGSTWLFSVPYLSAIPEEVDRFSPQFIVYLRVNRSLYRSLGATAEQYVVSRLRELITYFEGVEAVVHLCLGSPDLVLVGSFCCDAEHFLPFLAAIRSLTIPNSDIEIFSATLSMIAFPWPSQVNNESGDKGPLYNENLRLPSAIFAKVSSAFLQKLAGASGDISELFSNLSIRAAFILDGRYDFAFFLDDPKIGSKELSETLLTLHAYGSAKTESHILVSDPSAIFEGLMQASKTSLHLDPLAIDKGCSCSKLSRALVLDREAVDELPQGLRADIESLLSLFRSSLMEPTSCCDSERALRACFSGLKIILGLLKKCHNRLRKEHGEKKQRIFAGFISRYREALVEWCIHGERVLRERSIDSVSNPFRERKTIPEARGSLQKVLFLADCLVSEFYQDIDSSVKSEILEPGTFFATVYEPIGTIISQTHTGIIRIPSRYAFSLHLVLPQLWHEVGQFIFQNRYGHPFSKLTDAVIKENARKETRLLLLAESADLYADLLVLHYGFRDNLTSFGRYLITLFLESFLYERSPEGVQREKLEFLIRRLLNAGHFHVLLNLLWRLPRDGDFPEDQINEASRDFVANLENVFDATQEVSNIQSSARYLDQDLLWRPRLDDYERISETIIGNLEHGIYVSTAKYLVALLKDLRSCEPLEVHVNSDSAWEEIRKGAVIDLSGVRVNDIYLKLYESDTERLLSYPYGDLVESEFQAMAALGRSATLYFYKNSS